MEQGAESMRAAASISRPEGSLLNSCATAMAMIDRDLVIRVANPPLCEWLGSGTRSWRGDAVAMLDAKPPQLADAATRAVNEQRRIWLRDARVRTAIGDRLADLSFTPVDDDMLLVEVHTPGAETAGPRLSESLRGFAHEVKGPLAGVRGAAQLLRRHLKAPDQIEDFAACDGSTGSGAKVGPAAEWSIVVDQTIAGDRFEHRALTTRIFREQFAASGTQRSRGNDRFSLR